MKKKLLFCELCRHRIKNKLRHVRTKEHRRNWRRNQKAKGDKEGDRWEQKAPQVIQ